MQRPECISGGQEDVSLTCAGLVISLDQRLSLVLMMNENSFKVNTSGAQTFSLEGCYDL